MVQRTESSVPPFKSEFVKIMNEIGSRCCNWRTRSGLHSHLENHLAQIAQRMNVKAEIMIVHETTC